MAAAKGFLPSSVIGYVVNSKAYRFFYLHQRVIYESLDAGFYEDRFPFKLKTSGGSTSFSSPLTRYNKPSEDLDCEPRRSKRTRMFKGFGLDFHLYDLEEDPNTLQEALSHVARQGKS